ncbi:MAG: efflux RND transporter periplasmic adaptor subunit, partial [Candidatus Hydrogenedentes bacterium]|nr:efflux RND transporter periplasmic adaptor subunit [Candidatus Hydrogenedentota bacterium]
DGGGAVEKISQEERDPNRLWCNEHDLYEDECLICHPELADDEKSSSAGPQAKSDQLWCNEHNVAENECGICQPQRLAELPVGNGLKVRMGSASSLDKAGVTTGLPGSNAPAMMGEMFGEIRLNENQVAAVTPLGSGVITEILVDVGESVEAGQLLATLNSPTVAEGKSAYRKALAEVELRQQTFAREQFLVEQEISARQDIETASAALASARSEAEYARQNLLNLGFAEAEVRAMGGGNSDSRMLIRAPFSGTIVERTAVAGAAVNAGDPLFRVADLSLMWMELSVPENRLAQLKEGMQLAARFDAYPSMVFEGTVTWIGYRIEPATRMIEVRATLPNAQHLLKAGMFGKASLGGAGASAGVQVPQDAVQLVDGRPVIFAKLDDTLYETRLIETGVVANGRVAVLAGLSPIEEIVLGESHVLKSEFLKARLGAGCADH